MEQGAVRGVILPGAPRFGGRGHSMPQVALACHGHIAIRSQCTYIPACAL